MLLKVKSIRTKLILNATGIISFAFILTMLVNIFIVDKLVTMFKGISSKNSENISTQLEGIFNSNKEKIKDLIENQVQIKSRSLINEAELVLAPAFMDSAFSFISQLLSDRVDTDDDLVYASFFTHDPTSNDITLWTLRSNTSREPMVFGSKYDRDQKKWISDSKLRNQFTIDDEKIDEIIENGDSNIEPFKYKTVDEDGKEQIIEAYDVYAPVESPEADENSQRGFVRYIISLDKMQKLLAKEDILQAESKEKNQEKLHELLTQVTALSKKSFNDSITYLSSVAFIMIALSSLLFLIVAKKITIPIMKLKDSADLISSGNYGSAVTVMSDDEIGVLASTFESMRTQIKKFTEHLQALVDERTIQLREALGQVTEEKQKIQEILTHIEQGILMFDDTFKVSSQYSEHVKNIYEVEQNQFVESDVFEFLLGQSTDDKEMIIRGVDAVKMSVGDDYFSWLGNESHFPREVHVQVKEGIKILTMNWHPIVDEDNKTQKVIVSFFDITQKKALEEQIAAEKMRNQQLLNAISTILPHEPAEINRFFKTSHRELTTIVDKLCNDPDMDLDLLSRDLHTIKGNSRVFDLNEITAVIHETESFIKERIENFRNLAADKLRLCLELIGFYQDVFDNVLKLSSDTGQNQSLFSLIHMRIAEMNKKLEREGIEFKSLVCEDQVIHWSPSLMEKISDILTHAFTNAIDHGYILPMKRGLEKKPFKLKVAASHNGDFVSLALTDYGAGINFEKLKSIAIERGVKANTEEELAQVLFMQAVSTADAVTHTSGRGDGLAAIKDITNRLNAKIRLGNAPAKGDGALMVIDIPVSANQEKTKETEIPKAS